MSKLTEGFAAKGFDGDRMIFASSTFLMLFFGLCLLTKWVLWILFIITLGVSIWKGYTLFIKKKEKFEPLKEVKKHI